MLDHISRCSVSEQELSQQILLQAISSLENISQTSPILPREADITTGVTKQLIRILVVLNEVLFRKGSSSLQDKGPNEALPKSLRAENSVNITPPPGYSPDFIQEMMQDRVAGEEAEGVDGINMQESPRLGHPMPGEQMLDVYNHFLESTTSFPSRVTRHELDLHASSTIWFNVAALIKSVRSYLEIRYESVLGGLPRLLVEQIASWEMAFQVSRPASTNSIWNTDYQEQRVEVLGLSDLGVCYRLKCICPQGALHSLDMYCPRHLLFVASEHPDTCLRDSKEYNKKKKKKFTSPEQSEDENDDRDEDTSSEEDIAEEDESDHEPIEAREAANMKKKLQEREEKEIAGIMDMVGWKSAKEHILRLEAKVKASEMQGVDLKCEGFGTILMGGSGTGKTTYAHHYGAYLHAVGLVDSPTIKSTTGIYLADGGIFRVKNYIENMESDGGILFIDDAHFLLSPDHSGGVKVLDYLLQTILLHSAKITFILAGTEKGMRKIIGHGNHSTATMFPYLINFEDFQDDELMGIFGKVIKKKWDGKMNVEGGEDGLFVRIATRRVGRGRGMERFGNARAVEAFVGRVWERQVVRRGTERERYSRKSKSAQGNDSPSVSNEIGKDTLEVEKKADAELTSVEISGGYDVEGAKTKDEITSSEMERNVDNSDADVKVISVASKPDAVNKDIGFLPVSKLSESEQPVADKDENTEIRKERSEDNNDETQDTATDVDPDDYKFTKADILGPDSSNAVLNSPAWIQLQKLTGLEKVKESILSLLELVKANYQREMEEKPLLRVWLNRLFLGPPGTGKTLVAKLYGQLLAEIGILSKGEVLLRNPSDLLGQYIGDSEANTKAVLNAAIGNVLVIDEAYMMYGGGSDGTGNESDCYRQGIIDTLVGEIQSTPGEDRCVLLLGYDTAMEEMLQNSNPGLVRRFPLTDAFRFQNFTPQELENILRTKLADDVLEATEEAIRVAMDVLEKASQRANFGNGGEVANLISKAKTNYQSRISSLPVSNRPQEWILLPQDFDPSFNRHKSAPSNLRKLFADVVGCESVIHKLETYQRVTLAMKSRDLDPREYIPTNFVFKGPPGTGKTTTARKLASVYYDMGLLTEPSVVECSASDLIGKYIGHSGPKTAKVLEKALGRVLFIDEAYRLADGRKCSMRMRW